MLHRASERFVSFLIRQALLPAEYKEWAIYVLESKVQLAIGFSGIILICSIFASLVEIILFLLSMSLINSRSGGYHCSSFGKCFALSTLSTVGSLYVAKVLSPYSGISMVLITFGTLLLRPAPINNENLHLSVSEMESNKKCLRRNQAFIILTVIVAEICSLGLSIFLAQGYFFAAVVNFIYYCKTLFGGVKQNEAEEK